MTTDWLVNSNFRRILLIFGTAVDSANSNFGWSSLGKPARLPGAVDSLARGAGGAGVGTACGQCERPVCAARKIDCLLDFLAREERPNATR
jgi:hypothetical protein